jgi:hypothetical protein
MSKRESLRAALIQKTAEIEQISTTSVRRVMSDTQNNEQVYETFLLLEEEVNNAVEHVKLLKEVNRLLPFNNIT